MNDISDELGQIIAATKARLDARTPEEIARDEAAQADLEREEIEKQKRHELDLLERWGVPRRIRDCLGGMAETKALDAVRRWHSARKQQAWCIVLSADKGVGKSTAAGWWLSQAAEGRRPRQETTRCWWPASELAAADTYGEEFDSIATESQLVVDDLGVEYSDTKGAFASKFDRLLDARYREYRPTVITTNLAAPAFAQRYGERVYDRLCEGGVWVSIAGTSMRRARA